jgi:DNA-damage-inducible protein D
MIKKCKQQKQKIMKIDTINAKPALEEFSVEENGNLYWLASWYAKILGYKSIKTLWRSIDKARDACVHLGIPTEPNFIEFKGDHGRDMKLSKFGCFLVALHADARKPVVKRARSYFLNELEEMNLLVDEQDYLDRVIANEQINSLNKDLAIAGRKARVKDFQYFINEGYLGLYNSITTEIKQKRGVPVKADLNDYMGVPELAANIFRLSLTSERLKMLKNPSEEKAAKEHWKIGLQIRAMIKENTGHYPEDLPIHTNLKELQSKLKEAQKHLNTTVSELSE